MTLIRGTSLAGYPELVAELGGDPEALLRTVGISADAVGDYTAFIDYVGVLRSLEAAARVTGALDFGRRLAERQGVEIFGPVSAAARSAPTVGESVMTYARYLRAYSPAIQVGRRGSPIPTLCSGSFGSSSTVAAAPSGHRAVPRCGAAGLQVLAGFGLRPSCRASPSWGVGAAAGVRPLLRRCARVRCPVCGVHGPFERSARPLSGDRVMHEALVAYLEATTPSPAAGLSASVAELIRRLLPTGAGDLTVVAERLSVHPRTLQRRLAEEGTSYEALVDDVRRRTAETYLRDTDMTLSHLASELGYAEQSGLARAARRWFGASPRAIAVRYARVRSAGPSSVAPRQELVVRRQVSGSARRHALPRQERATRGAGDGSRGCRVHLAR